MRCSQLAYGDALTVWPCQPSVMNAVGWSSNAATRFIDQASTTQAFSGNFGAFEFTIESAAVARTGIVQILPARAPS